MMRTLCVLCFLVCCIPESVTDETRVCGTKYFYGASSTSNYVYCINGYHECTDRIEGCCPDTDIDPFPLALVILGPVTLACSLALTAFVLKLVIGTMLEDRDNYGSSPTSVID